jgi:hypothetical protein
MRTIWNINWTKAEIALSCTLLNLALEMWSEIQGLELKELHIRKQFKYLHMQMTTENHRCVERRN